MEYLKQKNKIIINGLEDFNIEDILLCGQVFRFYRLGEQWHVFSGNKCCVVKEFREQNYAEILTNNVDYFVNYFDLDTNYSNIKNSLKQFKIPFLNNAIDTFGGIRILNQDIFETFYSFVISQNNNIKRIQKIIETLCENFGTKTNDFYAFPTFDELKNVSEEQFKQCGLGYRASYFVKTLSQMQKDTLYSLSGLPQNELKTKLLSFTGVGNKVADCILLFGYHQFNSFPCDVWIERMYNECFEKETDREKISQNLVKLFQNLSGYAQQYLFYYIRFVQKG